MLHSLYKYERVLQRTQPCFALQCFLSLFCGERGHTQHGGESFACLAILFIKKPLTMKRHAVGFV